MDIPRGHPEYDDHPGRHRAHRGQIARVGRNEVIADVLPAEQTGTEEIEAIAPDEVRADDQIDPVSEGHDGAVVQLRQSGAGFPTIRRGSRRRPSQLDDPADPVPLRAHDLIAAPAAETLGSSGFLQ